MFLLRKYSLTICFIEALAIVGLVYLLVNHHVSKNFQETNFNVSVTESYKTYSNGTHSSKFIMGLVKGCTQRVHDFPAGIQCQSSKVNRCLTIEDVDQSSIKPIPAYTVTTSKTGDRLKVRPVKLRRIYCNPTMSFDDPCYFKTKIRLSRENLGQKIIGWGGALSDSSINNILSLTTNGTRRLLDDYFGSDGLRYNIIRITIGGSDFSSRFYTNDDEPDINMNKFQLKEEDVLYKIPLIKFIQTHYGDIKLFASMWSPPTWMKTNSHFNKGELRGSIDGSTIDRNMPPKQELFYDLLSELKVRFFESYMDNSIKFWGLTVMNEPLFSIQPFLDFNTMIFPREDYANYVAKYLGPKIKLNPKLAHLKLMCHDDNRRYLINYTMPILNNSKAKQFIDGASVHGYVDEAYDQMTTVYESFHNLKDPDFFVLPTELSAGHLPFMEKALVGNWARGMFYALDIINSLKHSASGWVDWNMVLDTEGGPGWLGGRLDAPVIVDKAGDSYYKSPMFYILGQFSRYIRPGSFRVQSEIVNAKYDNHFEAVTFVETIEQPNKVSRYTTVIVNNNPYPVEFVIEFSGEDSIEVPESAFIHECQADSVTSIVYLGEQPSDDWK